VWNAGYREVTPKRTNCRNGYRALDVRVGTMEVAIPNLRDKRDATATDWVTGRAEEHGGPPQCAHSMVEMVLALDGSHHDPAQIGTMPFEAMRARITVPTLVVRARRRRPSPSCPR
jgi:hypothetical protein